MPFAGWTRDARSLRPAPAARKKKGGAHKKKEAPRSVSAPGGVNPAATYSPGPGGQVPSARRGLTAVFGMGTGVTPARLPLKLKGIGDVTRNQSCPSAEAHGSGLLAQRELNR